MEQDKKKTPPSSAGCDTDRYEKRDNSAQRDERKEKRKESFRKHKGSQRSITEEQEIADKEISGEVKGKPFYPPPTSSSTSKHLREMSDAYLPHRKSDSKQSKPTIASASVPPCSKISYVTLQACDAAEKQIEQFAEKQVEQFAEKQIEQFFSFKPTKQGSLSDSDPFLPVFNSIDTSYNTPDFRSAELMVLEHDQDIKFSGMSVPPPKRSRTMDDIPLQMLPIKLTKPGSLSDSAEIMGLIKRFRRESEPCSPASPRPSSSAHLASFSESITPLDLSSLYALPSWSLTDSVGRSQENNAFSVQPQSEPGVYHRFGAEMGSPVTAQQCLIKKKTAADESKPQSNLFSMPSVTSAEMLRDTLKDSTPGTSFDTKSLTFFSVPPENLVQTFPSSPVFPTYAPYHIMWPGYLPRNQPPVIYKQSEKQRTADEKFSEEEVQVKLSSQSVGSLPHNSSSPSDFSIYGLHGYDSGNTHFRNSTLSSPYHHQQQQKLLRPVRPVYNKITERRGVEKRNQVSPSTSVHHDPSISDPVLGNKEWKSKTIIPRVSVISYSGSVVPQGSSTAEKQKEQTFPIKQTILRSLSEPSSAAISRNSSDSPDDILDQPPPALTETGLKNKASSAAGDTTAVSQDNAEEMEGVTGPSTLQPSTSNDDDSDFSLQADAFSLRSLQPESESGGDRDAHVEMEAFVTAVNLSVTNTLPTHFHLLQTPDCFGSRRASSCLPRSHSVSSLCQTGSAENKILTRTQSLPNMLLKSSFVEFTPDITDDGNDESYRFLCSCPGLYQCSVTDLVFHMDGEGEVVYRIVPWNRRLLAQHHKQPAGPLFDIKCLQQSVCQLHLPHCEIHSTGGCEFLSVAHVHDEGIEFISPHQITDTHVIINITGFSGFGNVKDEDSPPDPVRALVLLFYKPPAAPDVTSLLNVLMLPRNIVLQEVKRTRKKLVGDENYIETSSRCKLHPQQEYTLSTCPEDESVLVQPKEAEFESDNYDNYIPSFQVDIEKILKHINLFLRDSNKHSVWERRVCLLSTGVKRSCVPDESAERLLEIRSSFVGGISEPVLKSLLDRLFEKTVMTDSERESANGIQDKRDKARFVIDTVRKKGEAASSEMIEYLCKIDPFLCEHLGLI